MRESWSWRPRIRALFCCAKDCFIHLWNIPFHSATAIASFPEEKKFSFLLFYFSFKDIIFVPWLYDRASHSSPRKKNILERARKIWVIPLFMGQVKEKQRRIGMRARNIFGRVPEKCSETFLRVKKCFHFLSTRVMQWIRQEGVISKFQGKVVKSRVLGQLQRERERETRIFRWSILLSFL